MKFWAQLACVLVIVFQVAQAAWIDPGPLPPDPNPPTPVDPVDPAPFPAESLTVLIVEESTQRSALPQSQIDIFNAGQVWLDTKGVPLQILDPDTQGVNESPWREAFAVPRVSLPWVVISNGRSGFSGPLPGQMESCRSLVERFD